MQRNPFDLEGHVSVVTGGNGGIGYGIAESLIGAGASISIWARDGAKSERAVEQLTALGGGRVISVVCDVSDESAVASAVETTTGELGTIHSCFANAGIPAPTAPFVDTALSDWRRVIEVNLDGVFLTLRAIAAHMVEHDAGGSLVATSSLTTILGAPRNEAYAASKAGLLGLVRGLAVEFGRRGIRANAIVPGWIETDMNRDLLASDPFHERVLPRVPIRRWGTPADIGALAVYLASPGSAYHTGDTIVVDGGFRLS